MRTTTNLPTGYRLSTIDQVVDGDFIAEPDNAKYTSDPADLDWAEVVEFHFKTADTLELKYLIDGDDGYFESTYANPWSVPVIIGTWSNGDAGA